LYRNNSKTSISSSLAFRSFSHDPGSGLAGALVATVLVEVVHHALSGCTGFLVGFGVLPKGPVAFLASTFHGNAINCF
jgi:hypothetical protein